MTETQSKAINKSENNLPVCVAGVVFSNESNHKASPEANCNTEEQFPVKFQRDYTRFHHLVQTSEDKIVTFLPVFHFLLGAKTEDSE